MVNITVLKTFYDLKAHANRMPGDTFEATEERAARLMAVLPGYVELVEEADYTKMTVAELRALCAERGIEVPKGAKKADIALLLQE